MRDLATHGAQVLHPHALKYKDPLISAKIINFSNGDLSSEGTKITGPFEGDMLKTVSLYKKSYFCHCYCWRRNAQKSGTFSRFNFMSCRK